MNNSNQSHSTSADHLNGPVRDKNMADRALRMIDCVSAYLFPSLLPQIEHSNPQKR